MKLLWQTLILFFSFTFVFLTKTFIPSEFLVPILGILIIIFLLASARWRNAKKANPLENNSGFTVFALTGIIMLLIFGTGGINSALFFLIYFLSFGVAFVFEPMMVFVFLIGAILVFLPEALQNDVTGNFIKVGSIGLLAPLAFFFGYEYKKEEAQQKIMEKKDEKAEAIEEKAKAVLENEQENLSDDAVETLTQVVEDAKEMEQNSIK